MRIIGHLDMDAFFAAVEERDNPRWRGQPIAIGADPKNGQGRGVVSTANYPARQYGLRSALPISRAWRLSEQARQSGQPTVIFLPGDFTKYERVSKEIFEILNQLAWRVEPAGIDEGYFDLSDCGSFEAAKTRAQKIKKLIFKKEKLTASIGLASNKLVAKIASDRHKPDGLTVVLPEEVADFLALLEIRKIPGVGPKTEALLNKRGIRTVSHLREFSMKELKDWLGKSGSQLYEKIRGQDDEPVGVFFEAKSIGEQETFEKDSQETIFILERLRALSAQVWTRFKKDGWTNFQTIVLTVRFGDFETKTKSQTLARPAKSQPELEIAVLKLILPFLDKRANPQGKATRLIGVRVEKLTRALF